MESTSGPGPHCGRVPLSRGTWLPGCLLLEEGLSGEQLYFPVCYCQRALHLSLLAVLLGLPGVGVGNLSGPHSVVRLRVPNVRIEMSYFVEWWRWSIRCCAAALFLKSRGP